MIKDTTQKVIRREESQSDGYVYYYELIERKGRCMADFGMRLYSIKVTMTDMDGKSRQSEARDVFSSKRKALAFYEKIAKNLATPIDLKYVIEDEMTV